MATKDHDVLRPLTVLRPFLFLGKRFEIGSTFDPVEMDCNRHKVELFVNRGFLDPYREITLEQPENSQKEEDGQTSASDVEKPTQGNSQTENNVETEADNEETVVDSIRVSRRRRS